MPSDAASPEERVSACRKALRAARDPFHSALARTIEEVRAVLDARQTSEEEQVRGTGASLGAFAHGRVDPQRFAALLSHSLSIDETNAARIERAFEVLRGLNERIDGLLELRVPPGTSLRDAVGRRLAEIGRAFGAAHVVTAIRAGTYDEREHAGLLEGYPFARWSAAERALAPALHVVVDGADLQAPALAEFLDGHVRIALDVSGSCPVAPLARLIAPRTYVLQSEDPGALAALATWDGAGIAALVPAAAARFRHDPAEGGLHVEHLPDGRPRSVGGTSAAQQAEDLDLLRAWTRGRGEAEAVARSGGADPAGKLATWLLQQADLEGVG